MNTLGKTIGALAGVHALVAATSISAAPVQITSGLMTVSETNPDGKWMLAGENMSAEGQFQPLGGELPAAFLFFGPRPLGTSVGMSWFSDSIDGWTGQMLFDGVAYNLTGSVVNNSFWELTANDIFVDHAGNYVEPFTFFGTFCGFLTVPKDTCDATANLNGQGTLDLVVVRDPFVTPPTPASFDIQSISYRFAGAPEPDGLALLLTGLVGARLARRRHGARRLRLRRVP